LSATPSDLTAPAAIFAALGDETRLSLVRMLSDGRALSISRLTGVTTLTRQAVTRHLSVLEASGLVASVRKGRENLFVLQPNRLEELKAWLDAVSRQWDDALAGLKSFVEDESPD